MRILVINPNTTQSMTETIGAAAGSVANSGTEIVARNPVMGPVSIEGHYDEVVAALGVVDEIRKGEEEGFDGYVIACFGDPGLAAAREIAKGPVIGIAEAAMHAASMVSTGFSIVTTLERSEVIAEHLVQNYGMERQCRRVRSTSLAVLELEDENSNARARILDCCRLAIEEDRAGAIILGCAGMADLAKDLTQELGLPVIDGVAAGVKLAEALIGMGFGTSKLGDYAPPLPKTYVGELTRFAP